MSVADRQAARAEQEQRRIAQIQSQGTAAPDARFMAGPNAINAPAQPPTAPPPVQEQEQPAGLQSPDQAVRLAKVLQARGRDGLGDEMYERSINLLKDYETRNPGEMAKFNKSANLSQFETEMIERSPVDSSFEARQKKQRDITSRVMLPRRKLEDLPEDSRERVLRNEELSGLDTTTGFGDNIVEVMHAAAQFDSPRVKRAFLESSVRDEIEAAGITLPEGAEVVGLNENLNEVMYLRPTKDGKLRWTLSNSENFRVQDFGMIADPSELLSMVGSVVGTVATKNKAIGEFAGDLVGRNVGLAIEYAISSGEVTPEDMGAAMMGTPFESAFETIASRVIGRVIDIPGRKSRVLAADEKAVTDAQANIAETADALDTINRINGPDGRKVSVTPAEAANQDKALVTQRSKEKNLPSKKKEALEVERLNNQRALGEATENSLGPTASSTSYNPAQAVADIQETVGAAHRAARHPDATPETPLITKTSENLDNGVEVRTYSFSGDEAKFSTSAELGGEGFNQGARVIVSHDTQEVLLHDLFAGTKTQGQTIALLNEAYTDTAALGYSMGSGNIVSPSAQKMITRLEGMGWSVAESPNAVKLPNGHIRTTDGSPVYTVVGAPGEVVLSREFAQDSFDRMAIEGELEQFEAMLPAAQQYANDANTNLLNILGWNKQRRYSNYSIDNPGSTGLRTQIRALQNRNRTALTQSEATDGERLLAAATRREVDEEGNDFLTGLASEQLDFANVITARDRLARIAQETEDPDALRLVQTLDNLIKNGTTRTAKGNVIAASTRKNITDALANTRSASKFVEEAQQTINASRLFEKNKNGEYLYTNLKDWDSLMAGGARFIKNMRPLIDGSPILKKESAAVMRQLYRERVMPDGVWSRTRHNTFMNRYSESLPVVFNEADMAELAKYELASGKGGVWNRLVGRAQERAAKATSFVDGAKGAPKPTGDAPPSAIKINPKSIIASINSQPPQRTAAYMRWVRKNDPAQFAQLQEAAKHQIQTDLQTKFFSPDAAGQMTRAKANRLSAWVDGNKDTIREVLGEEYYANIRAIAKANDVSTRAFRVKGTAEETQTILTRTFRSLIGPLSRPQRQLTAAQFARTRLSARRAIRMMSDPAAIREIMAATKNGVTMESQAGIALFSRLGLWSDFGVVGDPADPEYQAQAMTIWNQLKEDTLGEFSDVE